MTTNGSVATANGLIAVALIFLGCALLWQARPRLWRWPVSALVALAGPYLTAGLVIGQLALFRTVTIPAPFGPNGYGTLGLRCLCAFVVLALLQRVVRG